MQTLLEVDTKTKVEAVKFIAHDVSTLVAIGSSTGVDIWDYSKKVCFEPIIQVSIFISSFDIHLFFITLQVQRHSIECSSINRMCYDVNRHLIYAGGLIGEIYVISCLSGSIIYYFVGHRQNILHLSISR